MNLFLKLTQILMRLDQWRISATLLARMPFASLDATARGRLSYALLMLHRTNPAEAKVLLARVLKQGEFDAPLLVELATIATRVADEPLTRDLLTRAVSKSNDTVTHDAAATLLNLHQSLADGSLSKRIAALIDEADVPSDGLLTLVPVSSRYMDMWALWIEQVRKHIGGTVVAIALDDDVLAPLREEAGVVIVDAREFFAWKSPGALHNASRGVLWQVRTLLLRELVHRNRNVLVLDLDAIAISDVQPVFDSMPDADLIAQEDHSLPMDVNRQLGFILCCGFMLSRPTPAAKTLVDRFAGEVMVERDDQLALNHILGRDGITNKTADAKGMQFVSKGVRIACPNLTLVSRTLHSGTVVRHFQQEGHTVSQLRQALGLSEAG